MAEQAGKFDEVELTRAQADKLLVGKVREIFEIPAVVKATVEAAKRKDNPLGLSGAEKKLLKTFSGGLVGRFTKGTIEGEVRKQAVDSDRARNSRNALLDSLEEPITVGGLEEAMATVEDHVNEFKVLGFDDENKVRGYAPKGVDAEAFVEGLRHFSEKELKAAGVVLPKAGEKNWAQDTQERGGQTLERG